MTSPGSRSTTHSLSTPRLSPQVTPQWVYGSAPGRGQCRPSRMASSLPRSRVSLVTSARPPVSYSRACGSRRTTATDSTNGTSASPHGPRSTPTGKRTLSGSASGAVRRGRVKRMRNTVSNAVTSVFVTLPQCNGTTDPTRPDPTLTTAVSYTHLTLPTNREV